MPTYYDDKTKTWYCKFYYTDYTGIKKQKKKRGFPLQRDAKKWERTFLEKQQADLNMPFNAFVNLYMEDMEHRFKQSTYINKKKIINLFLLKAFNERPLASITPADVRRWHNDLMNITKSDGSKLSPSYLKSISVQMSSIFNFAVKYYGLKDNPCQKAGSIGNTKNTKIDFWTFDEFAKFIHVVEEPIAYTIFMTLYYTGMRIGELLALSVSDIDFDNSIIHVSKSMQRIKKQYVITSPKTKKSTRDILIPDLLVTCLQNYVSTIYKPDKSELIFQISREPIRHKLNCYAKLAGVKKIRLHDLRHSHASLLIELGFSPLLIAERLGHENIETTLNVYSHLYPNKQEEVARKLQELYSTISVPQEI